MSIASRIYQRRVQLNLSRDALGELASSDQKQIWRYEKGKTIPSAEAIIALARALQVSTDWLLGMTDEIRPLVSDSSLDKAEIELLRLYRQKTPEKQDTILNIVRAV